MVKIEKLLTTSLITLRLEVKEKEDVLEELVDLLIKGGAIKKEDKAKVLKCIVEREALMSTGIGNGVALPHGKCDAVDKIVACFGRSVGPINYQALDKQPVNIFFMLVAPKNDQSATEHIKALARISRLLKHKQNRQSLVNAQTPDEVIKIIANADANQ